jgi:hypothetical protein
MNWYELEAELIMVDNHKPTFLEISAKKNIKFSENFEPNLYPDFDIPVTIKSLKDGLVTKLVENLKSNKNKDAIVRAIQYLLSSYDEEYFFSKLVSAYTSFETLVAELSKTSKIDTILNGEQYAKVTECITGCLDNCVSDKNIKDCVLLKIPELKRPPIKTTFKKLFNPDEYPLSRFMFKNTNWDENMGGLISRRNKLVHVGEFKQEHFLDLYRLHLLLELWILKLLGCPDEDVNEHLANFLKNNRSN